MQRSISILLVFFLSTVILVGQDQGDVVVRERSASAIVLEFHPQFFTQAIRGAGGGHYTFVGFTGGILSREDPGQPMIPFRVLPLELQGENWEAEIVDVRYTELPGHLPAPYPAFRREDEREFGAVPVFSGRPSGAAGFAPSRLTEVEKITTLSGTSTILLKLYPLQYDEARQILRRYDAMVVRVKSVAGSSRQVASRQVPDSPLKQGEWYKMDIGETGIYKLDQSFFINAGIAVSAVSDIGSIRVYGNGGRPLPEGVSEPRPSGGLQEVARMIVDRNGNGLFDAEDYLLFYGASTRGWRYNPATKTFNHSINHYTDVNAYFFTFGGDPGKSMDSVASGNASGPFVEDFQEKVFVEEERNNLIHSGRQWLGPLFDSESRTAVYTTLLPGFVSAKPTTYRFLFLGRSLTNESFQIEENGEPLGNPIITLGIDVRDIEGNAAYRAPLTTISRQVTLPDDRSILRFSFSANSSGANGWLDWFEILYRRRFEALNDFIAFSSPDTTGVMEYRVSGFSSRDVNVFDVSVHDSVVRITNLTVDPIDPGMCAFQSPQTAGGVRQFLAIGPNGFLVPTNVRKVENTNLQGLTTGAEFVIITPREFRSEADRLAAHREQGDSLTCLVVDIENIVNEYSGGNTDPLAVRDFLLSTRGNWSVPVRYVLLFGDGHYDYKNIRASNRNWIPPYETLESVFQILSYASDDHLGILNPGDTKVSVAIGRLPINSLGQARAAVDKIIAYETTAPLEPWRNRVTYVADDGLTSTRDDGSIHTLQAEVLAQSFTPAIVEKKKIFIVEYPTVNSAAGRRKPTANTAIVEAINDGTLILNYTGHGNPQLWAHEAIFTREASLPLLRNYTQPFFLVAATCDFARYDDPAEESAGELLLTMAQGGAIGVVTASRAVYSFQNSQFNNTLYAQLFPRDPDGRPRRLVDAMYRTKQILSGVNDIKYHLFADPTMRLNLPATFAGVDSIDGAPLSTLVQVSALSRIEINGLVLRPDGSPSGDFTGRALLEMFDSKRRVFVPEWGNFSFEVNGSLLYRGEISVNQGKFRATVPIPKDVSYDNNRARISVYARSSSSDAVGYTENIVIAGTDSAAAVDSVGPLLQVFLDDESFRSGDVVSPDALLLVKLFDQSGINTSTASVGHRLEATLSGIPQSIDLTPFYRGDLDTYQSGEVRYQLRDLSEGGHSLKVKAWDIYNNSAQEEIAFDVRAVSDLKIYNVFNFPNPVVRSTVFTFQRNSSDPIDVEVKIYTLAGRLVKIQEGLSVVDRFVRIPWDGRDQNGDPIANGVYFYKVVTRSSDRRTSEEVIGKLTVLR
ncbi:MAG: type IX secretion system sortase PorU [Ignavibacteriales bacterium]|nr:type IX secretion system sortase PorU [Ignavibacteriales bacterium]